MNKNSISANHVPQAAEAHPLRSSALRWGRSQVTRVVVMALIYLIWLCVLGYIGWVNVQSGNQ